MVEFGKRVGYISSVEIQDGTVVCDVEDKDTPNKVYSPVIYTRNSINSITVPPKDTKVLVERVTGEFIITGVLSTPGSSGMDESNAKSASQAGAGSMSLTFHREGAEAAESIAVEYSSSGYNVSLDVDGDVTLEAGGNIVISKGGTTKKVATEDHVHSTSNGTTGKPDDVTSVELE